MRYVAQRIRTGEWLHRDLPIADGERTRELSGPGTISGRIEPRLRDNRHADGLRVLEEWATAVYAVNDEGRITQGGLVVPTTDHEPFGQNLTIAGFATYPQGYPYTDARNWGPFVDPIQVYRDHWDWLQRQGMSNLNVRVVGTEFSNQRIGDNSEPYRLSWVDQPDLGGEMDSLAEQTPFDYVEEHEWASDARESVEHRIRIGHPRLGRARHDLRFVQDENITAHVVASTGGNYANDVIGIGNGEGASMVWSRIGLDDGRLRRITYVTDKTITRQAHMDAVVRDTLRRAGADLNITEVEVRNHRNAPLGAINLGDDILVQTYLDTWGDVVMWVRVLAITEVDSDLGFVRLATEKSSSFRYNDPSEDTSPPPTPVDPDPVPITPVPIAPRGFTNAERNGGEFQNNPLLTIAFPSTAKGGDIFTFVGIASTLTCTDSRAELVASGTMWGYNYGMWIGVVDSDTPAPLAIRMAPGGGAISQFAQCTLTAYQSGPFYLMDRRVHRGETPGNQGAVPAIPGVGHGAFACGFTVGGIGGSYGWEWSPANPQWKPSINTSYGTHGTYQVVGPAHTNLEEIPAGAPLTGNSNHAWAFIGIGCR